MSRFALPHQLVGLLVETSFANPNKLNYPTLSAQSVVANLQPLGLGYVVVGDGYIQQLTHGHRAAKIPRDSLPNSTAQ